MTNISKNILVILFWPACTANIQLLINNNVGLTNNYCNLHAIPFIRFEKIHITKQQLRNIEI